MSRILRYEVPVDDEWHPLDGFIRPIHVGCRNPGVVEFWAWEGEGRANREYRVAGTGQEISDVCAYVGTVVAPGGHLVWHLLERHLPLEESP